MVASVQEQSFVLRGQTISQAGGSDNRQSGEALDSSICALYGCCRRSALRSILAIFIAASMLAGCQSAPFTGRSQLMFLSDEEEREMGLMAYRQVLSHEAPSHDMVANRLVEKVGRRIAAAAEAPPPNLWQPPHYRWEFETIDRRMVNAFCMPGGKVAVYTGILPITQDEAGLAAVIGHEVAHALARHVSERLSDQKAANLTVAAVGIGLAVNRRTSPIAPLAMAALGAGATYGVLLPMSRTHESEADHIGLIVMALAGYDPHAAIGVWERMRAANAGSPRLSTWLSTHPSNEQRIRDIRAWVPEAMKYYRPQ
jgi:metalloendopeptidase OMA1, mitochondrial